VIIHRSASVRASADDREQRTADGELDVLDKRVLTDTGDELGAVEDVEFNPMDGHLQQLTMDGRTLTPDRLLGIGSYAVMVTSEADDLD